MTGSVRGVVEVAERVPAGFELGIHPLRCRRTEVRRGELQRSARVLRREVTRKVAASLRPRVGIDQNLRIGG